MIQRKRHIAKTLTWRIIGSIDTFLISFILSGNINFGLSIASIEIFTKMILYYLHERFWYKFSRMKTYKRHLFKTFSWRFVGTTDTILISTIVIGDPITGLNIGIIELLTKMFLYYFHEKIWYRFNYGLTNRNLKNE